VGLTLDAREGSHAGATLAIRPLLPGESRELGDVTLAPAAMVGGEVVDAFGRSAGAARVRAEGASLACETVADADGRFRFEGLDPGWTRLVARAPSGETSCPIDVLLVSGECAESVRISIGETGSIEGQVVDAAQEPVVGAEIAAYETGVRTASPRRAKSDALGRFSIDGLRLEATFDAEVRARGFASFSAKNVRPGGEPLGIRVRRAAAVSGEVRGAADLGPVFLTIESEDPALRGRSLVVSRPGPFREDNLEPGIYSITARVDGVLRARQEGLALLDGEALEGVVLDVGPPARAVCGRVLSAVGGAPLSGARLFLHAKGDGSSLSRFSSSSDAAGRFEIALPENAVAVGLVASLNGYGASTLSLAADSGARGREPIDVFLRRAGRLVIRLESAGSGAALEPVSRATVVAARSDVPVSLPIPLEESATGIYEGDLEAGDYHVAAGARGFETGAAFDVAIAPGSTVERHLGLVPSAGAEGRCRSE
jgi:hypothetical protein